MSQEGVREASFLSLMDAIPMSQEGGFERLTYFSLWMLYQCLRLNFEAVWMSASY
jgi:hypothetical protein